MGLPKLDDKKLVRYVEGDLSPSEMLIVEEALERDPIARQKVRILAATGQVLKRSLGKLRPPSETRDVLSKISAHLQTRDDLEIDPGTIPTPPNGEQEILSGRYSAIRRHELRARISGTRPHLQREPVSDHKDAFYDSNEQQFSYDFLLNPQSESAPVEAAGISPEAWYASEGTRLTFKKKQRNQVLAGLAIGLALGVLAGVAIAIAFLI